MVSSNMLNRIKDKFSTKTSTPHLKNKHSDFNMGNSNTTPSYDSNNPFLDIPTKAPPAYESTTKASNLELPCRAASPAPSITSVTCDEDRYAFLTTFDTVFVIDDSGSMTGRSWREVREALSTIAPICTSHDPDGIDVYFLNHRSTNVTSGTQAPGGYYQIRDANEVQHLFKSVRPCGSTPTGARLHSILKPYVSHISRRAENIDSTKPVNIIVITDGYPTDDPESIIVHHAKKLDQIEAPPHQIGIQFFQVGDKHGATKALRELDDDLKDQGIRDMVDTTTWNSTTPDNSHTLSGEGILKVVLGAVVRRIDRGTPRDNPQGHGQ